METHPSLTTLLKNYRYPIPKYPLRTLLCGAHYELTPCTKLIPMARLELSKCCRQRASTARRGNLKPCRPTAPCS